MAKETIRKVTEPLGTGLSIDDPMYKDLQDNKLADLRMVTGADRYGKSWMEVDLKTDLEEELLDAHNYAILILLRMVRSGQFPTLEQYEMIMTFKEQVKDLLAELRFFPDFEGPTSAEWIKNGATV